MMMIKERLMMIDLLCWSAPEAAADDDDGAL